MSLVKEQQMRQGLNPWEASPGQFKSSLGEIIVLEDGGKSSFGIRLRIHLIDIFTKLLVGNYRISSGSKMTSLTKSNRLARISNKLCRIIWGCMMAGGYGGGR